LQPELFSNRSLDLEPARGQVEPRLWVRRLIIWREPGDEVRNVPLRPGLNIIWSPDDGSQQGRIGHGGGKTTLCRLIRYCLGEDSFGPEAQRRAILERMPNGAVGAEIRLDGETWLIRRSLSPFRQDYSLKATSFADLADFPSEPTGLQPFRDVVTRAFLGGALPLVPDSIGESGAWQALLAWLSRDQECRFGHLLDWRSPDSGSRSPVSGRNRPQDDREAIVRIVLNALRSEEIEARKRWEAENAALTGQRTKLGRLNWRLEEMKGRLAKALGLESGGTSKLDAAIIKSAASEQLAKIQGLQSPVTLDQLRAARKAAERAAREEAEAKAAIERASSTKASQEKIAAIIADELPELSAQNQRLANPICPICGVLIDKARAEGCGISLQTCDLEAIQAKVRERVTARNAALADVARLQGELPSLQHKLATAHQVLGQVRSRLEALEKAAFDQSRDFRRAQRNLEDAHEFARTDTELQEVERSIEQKEKLLRELATDLEQHRSTVADFIGRLSDRFDAVFHQIVPTDERSSVTLDGNGLRMKMPVNGAAIDSLRIAIFDLAVLSMGIEGRSRHPGFLIHDSPREADLGGSIYAGLFDLAKKLESFGPAPLFQYIVTTTTQPPLEFSSPPWLCLKVRGAPAEDRLLKADL
jgi:hypothetical protein